MIRIGGGVSLKAEVIEIVKSESKESIDRKKGLYMDMGLLLQEVRATEIVSEWMEKTTLVTGLRAEIERLKESSPRSESPAGAAMGSSRSATAGTSRPKK